MTNFQNITVDAIERQKARISLLHFIQYTMPNYKAEPFHIDLCKEVEKFYIDICENNKDRKLMIFAPPRAGKSQIVTKHAPAWAFGKWRSLGILGASNSHDLATKGNKAIQRIIMSDKYREVFPDTRLPEKNSRSESKIKEVRNVDEFEIIGETESYKCASSAQSISGFGATILICDDPYGNRAQAESTTQRNKIYDWWTDDFTIRLNRDTATGTMLMHTRWHQNDLAGRLQETENDWDILIYPALNENDESLCPIRLPIDFLKDYRRKNAYGFESLFMQNPIVKGGNVFKEEWFQYLDFIPQCKQYYIFADTAQMTGKTHDYSVFQLWGSFDKGIVLIDQIRGKWEAPELEIQATAFWNKCIAQYRVAGYYIEQAASGTGLMQSLKRTLRLPIVPILRAGKGNSKEDRADRVVNFVFSGNVFLLKNASYLSDFLSEVSAFPNGTHDDQVDPFMDAIEKILMAPPKKIVHRIKQKGL